MAKEQLSVRIDSELKSALERVCDQNRDIYAPSKAKLVERGIELALRELEAKKGGKHGR